MAKAFSRDLLSNVYMTSAAAACSCKDTALAPDGSAGTGACALRIRSHRIHVSLRDCATSSTLQELRIVSAQALKLAETCIQLRHQHFKLQSPAQPAQGPDASQLAIKFPIPPVSPSIPEQAAPPPQHQCPEAPPSGPLHLAIRSCPAQVNQAHVAGSAALETLKDTVFPIPSPSLRGQSSSRAPNHAPQPPLPASSSSCTSSSAPSTVVAPPGVLQQAANLTTQQSRVEDQDELLQEAISLLDSTGVTPNFLSPRSLSPTSQQPTTYYQHTRGEH
eukprot:scaffold227700_cov17-Tisochrysis_lutea.AAC.1